MVASAKKMFFTSHSPQVFPFPSVGKLSRRTWVICIRSQRAAISFARWAFIRKFVGRQDAKDVSGDDLERFPLDCLINWVSLEITKSMALDEAMTSRHLRLHSTAINSTNPFAVGPQRKIYPRMITMLLRSLHRFAFDSGLHPGHRRQISKSCKSEQSRNRSRKS